MKRLIMAALSVVLAMPAAAQVREGTIFRLTPSSKQMMACTDPTSGGGLAATVGSFCLGTTGIYRKFSTGATDWTPIALSTPVTVPNGGTGLSSGTSGGVPYYNSSTTIASSGALTANLPVIGGGAGNPPTSGTRTGNTTEFASWTGTKTSGACVEIDASGNLYAESGGCSVSGGAITIPFTYEYVVGLCQNATATLGMNTPTSNPATVTCVTGSNTQLAVASFADSASQSVQGSFALAPDWTGNIDLSVKWRTSATTGSVVWQVQTICVANAETVDPSFNTASTVTDAALGTTLQLNDASMTSITITGCAAGERLYWKFLRDAAHGSDDLAAAAQLISLVFTVRRAI